MQVECGLEEHTKLLNYLSLPATIVYVLGMPFAMWASVYQIRDELNERHHLLSYGFIYHKYTAKCWWWEMYVMMRKLAMTWASVYLVLYDTGSQALFALCVVLVGNVMHAIYEPLPKTHRQRYRHRLHVLPVDVQGRKFPNKYLPRFYFLDR